MVKRKRLTHKQRNKEKKPYKPQAVQHEPYHKTAAPEGLTNTGPHVAPVVLPMLVQTR